MDVLGCLSSSPARIAEAAAFTPSSEMYRRASSPRFCQAKIPVARRIHSFTRDLGVNMKREVNGITIEIPKIGEVGIFSANQSAWLSKFWRLYFFRRITALGS
jgi:hypothetical protein